MTLTSRIVLTTWALFFGLFGNCKASAAENTTEEAQPTQETSLTYGDCIESTLWTASRGDINMHDCYEALAELRTLADFYENYIYEFWSRRLGRPRFRNLRRNTPLAVTSDGCAIVIVPTVTFNTGALPDIPEAEHHHLPVSDLATYVDWYRASQIMLSLCSPAQAGGWRSLGREEGALATLLMSVDSYIFHALNLGHVGTVQNVSLYESTNATFSGANNAADIFSSLWTHSVATT